MKIKKKTFQKQRGDAMILLSIAVTGLVMLVSVMAIERLKQSTKLQNTQKISLQNSYQAEEGIEYSLFAAKEGLIPINDNSTNVNAPLNRFKISLWENENSNALNDKEALEKISGQSNKDRYVISSQNKSLTSETNSDLNKKLQKSAFSNVPTRFYQQLTVWNNMKDDCSLTSGDNSCSPVLDPSDGTIVEGKNYQVFSKVANGGDNWSQIKFRIKLSCLSSDCEVEGLRLCALVPSEITSCPIKCDAGWNNLKFWGEKSSAKGPLMVSDWFAPDPQNIAGKNAVIQFVVKKGKLSETKVTSSNEIKMCIGKNADYTSENPEDFTPSYDKRGGVISIEAKNFQN